MNQAIEEWIVEVGVPENVQAVIEERPCDVCYKSMIDRGHYWITGYVETPEGVTVQLRHGKDSFFPGFTVPQYDPAALMTCGCGQYREPSSDQVQKADAVVAALAKHSGLHLPESSEPSDASLPVCQDPQ